MTIEAAEASLAAARPFQARVAVTAATDRDTLRALARIADHLQCPVAGAPAAGAVRPEFPHLRLLLSTRPDRWTEAARVADAVVLDALTPDGYGGTGNRVDAETALSVVKACARPVVLAGGLTPDNVAEAIRAIRPWGVDVATGVETDGVRDPAKVRAFVAAAKGAIP